MFEAYDIRRNQLYRLLEVERKDDTNAFEVSVRRNQPYRLLEVERTIVILSMPWLSAEINLTDSWRLKEKPSLPVSRPVSRNQPYRLLEVERGGKYGAVNPHRQKSTLQTLGG